MPRSSSNDKAADLFDLRHPPRVQEDKNEEFPQPNRDDRSLIKLGKKPIMKRDFGFLAIIGFSCTVLITWEGALILASSALTNGGPAGVLWGFLINWLGIMSAFASIAELASMAPVSGGQFHWISLLAPASSQKFWSYLTGWITVLGWQAVTLSSANLNASVLQQIIVLLHPNYAASAWQTMLVTWAVLAFSVVFNLVSSLLLAQFEQAVLVLHILGFFGVLIPLVTLGPHGNASVFTTLYNGGGWSSNGLSFLVGMPSLVFSIFGADSVVHMSEEIRNASTIVPRALMLSLGINGALGFAMLVALMFCLGSLSVALSPDIGFAFIEIFENAVHSKGGAAAMAAVVDTLGICATVGSLAATTRLLWAFARENGVPFSSFVSKIYPNSVLPLDCVAITLTASVLLSLIQLGSPVALGDIVNLSVAALFSSYLICTLALLIRRLQGKIEQHDDSYDIRGPDSLRWGPWRIPEPLGTINNAFACLFLTWTLFWSFWSPYKHVTPSLMNYNVLVFGGTVLGGVAWYFAVGRKSYIGPLVEFD